MDITQGEWKQHQFRVKFTMKHLKTMFETHNKRWNGWFEPERVSPEHADSETHRAMIGGGGAHDYLPPWPIRCGH